LDHPELKIIQDRINMVNLRDGGYRNFPQESLHNLNTTEGVTWGNVDLFMEEKARRDEIEGVEREPWTDTGTRVQRRKLTWTNA
jgi:hypothetical protein